MSMTVDQLAEEALALSPAEREDLAERLVLSLGSSQNAEIEEAWMDEALRRLEAIEAGTVKTVPYEEGMARIRRALGQ